MLNLRKWIALALVLLCILGMAACGSNEANNTEENQTSVSNQKPKKDKSGKHIVGTEYLEWEDVTGGVAITRYFGTAAIIELPEIINEKKVVEIQGGAFQSNVVRSVTLPDTVVRVSDNAFYCVTSLEEVFFGTGVKDLGDAAFEGCTSLKTVELNEGLKTIGSTAFYSTTSLSYIHIPDTVESIGADAFIMSGLKEITIPGSVSAIEYETFAYCEELKKVVIEPGVKSIDDRAFESCFSLKSAKIPSSVEEIGFAAFRFCEDLTIHTTSGSFAEKYAKENKINFAAIADATDAGGKA